MSTSGVSALQGLFGAGASLTGLGVSMSNQQNNYNVLQNALGQIGPTALPNVSVNGPGGIGGTYSPTGGVNVGLGSLTGAFNGLVGAGGAGAAGYSPALLSGLTGSANGTVGSALSGLNSAYAGNNSYQTMAAGQASGLNQTYGQVYNNTLNSLHAEQQPQVQQQAFGLQNTLFGSGVLGSTGAASGAIAAGNFGSQVNAMNAQDAMTAQQQGLSAMNSQAGLASVLSNTGNNLLNNAFSNFGNTASLVSGLNTSNLTNGLSALQGAGALNTLGLNNFLAGLQSSSAASTARNQSLFPYANVALGLSGAPNAQTMLGQALSGAGTSLLGTQGLAGLLHTLTGGSATGNGSGSALPGILGTIGNGVSSLWQDLTGGPSASAASTGLGNSGLNQSLLNGMTSQAGLGPLYSGNFGSSASQGLPSYNSTPGYSGLPSYNSTPSYTSSALNSMTNSAGLGPLSSGF